ncbi:MAG: hypothetical protein UV60_C0028G0007 [Parcubacteria group bacterium GW2011_GWA2_43_11]|nr:MAG: hypothetical protein UU89_C0026G0009 [Parcubacteria group bacterium GW2011_GWC2_42_11]KKS84115.1 MAG: hypothetical protein UV60_C0028G0007 [Parcubacteria group bacterium GW2011_GWA2_43_11]
MGALNQDIKNFRNPSRHWKYNGAFSVELEHDADMSIVPTSATIKGDSVHVRYGLIKQTMSGIQFYSRRSPFHWGYPFIKVIRDEKGNLLWVNDKHR